MRPEELWEDAHDYLKETALLLPVCMYDVIQ